MQLIRCTAKLRKEMGLSKKDLFEGASPEGRFGQWHANLIYIFGRKCVVFINDRTLLNFIQPDVRRAQIRTLDDLFRDGLRPVLEDQDLTQEQMDAIMSEYREVDYAKSNDRSVLGSLNEVAFQYEYHLKALGRVTPEDVRFRIYQTNRMPMGAQDYATGSQALHEYVEKYL